MTQRHLRAGMRLLLIALTLTAPACQPTDLPRETAAADSSEPPPPPPPLPTETVVDTPTGASATEPADSPSPPAAVAPAETAVVRPPTPPPAPPPAVAAPSCDVQAPASAEGQRLTVFFTCGEEVRAVERVVPPTRAVLRAALEQLLRGPTAEERAAGFHSFFGDATANALRSVVVRDGVAHIDFADFSRAIPNASSSAGSAQLLGQLRATIFQYPAIRTAEITFDRSCDAFWNWLQRDCQRLSREGN